MNQKIKLVFMLAISVVIFSLISGCATGSTLITGKSYPPTKPENIEIIRKEPSKPFVEIGIVSADSSESWSWSGQGRVNDTLQDLKVAAAKVGANAVIITTANRQAGNSGGFFSAGAAGNNYGGFATDSTDVLQGIAIRYK